MHTLTAHALNALLMQPGLKMPSQKMGRNSNVSYETGPSETSEATHLPFI